MSGAFDAGTVTGRLVLDLQQWTASVETAKKDTQSLAGLVASKQAEIEKLGKAFTIAGAAIVGSLGMAVKSAVDFTLEAGRMSVKTGIAVETISGLREAADNAGVSMEELGGGLRKYASLAADAAGGNKAAIDTLAKLGISATDASGKLKPMDQLLMEAADAFSKMENGSEKSALAMDLFGKSGTEMIPLLNKGSEGIKSFTKDAKDMGIMITNEGVAKAKDFSNSFKDLNSAFMGIKIALANAVIPVVKTLSDAFGFVTMKVQQLYNFFPPLGNAITLIVGAFGSLSLVLGTSLLVLVKFAAIWKDFMGLIPVMQARWLALNSKMVLSVPIYAAVVAGILAVNAAVNAYSAACDRAMAKTVESNDTMHKGWDFAQRSLKGLTEVSAAEMRRIIDSQKRMGESAEEIGETIYTMFRLKIGKAYQAVKQDSVDMADKVKEVTASLADKMKELTSNEFEYRIYQAKVYYADQLEKVKGSIAYAKLEADAKKAYALEVGKIRREQAEASAEKEKQTAEKSKQAADRMWKAWEEGARDAKDTIQQVMFSAAQKIYEAQKMVLNAMGPFFRDIVSQGEQTTKKVKTKFQKAMEKINNYVQIMQQGFGQFFSSLSQLSQQRYDNEMSLLQSEYEKKKKQIEDSLMSEEEKKAALLALDEKYQGDQKALKQKQLETEKKANIIQALMNMAAAITAAWTAGPFIGIILSALAAAACAIQIKAIKAQRVELAEGGVATRPTNALIGEAGPEAVMPLRELGRMLGIDRKQSGGNMSFQFNIKALDGADVEQVTRRRIIPEIQRMIRREAFTIAPNAVRY